MSNKLVFASGNPHKLAEIAEVAGADFKILSPAEAGIHLIEPEESEATLEGNALLKATAFYDQTGMDCFAEDTGLEVQALDGAPGVHTARYAGPENDASKNIAKLLDALDGKDNRRARFRAIAALIIDGIAYTFEGIVEGSIALSPCGTGGFGYDPVFIPEGFEKTFAELPTETKNALSHRAKAVRKMLEFCEGKSIVIDRNPG
jgi:XTP/dITP diphosphohydrolase